VRSCWQFTAPTAIKYAPQSQIIAEVLVVMLDAGGHEQDVTCIEPVPFVVVDEHATPTNDDIELVLFVWRLLVRGKGGSRV
jgi:hypothetical protein